MAAGLDRRFHPGNVAVMVRSPDINQEVIAAQELVAMVGDIRGQIGVFPFLFPDDTILFIPKRGCTEPQRTILFKQ